jgi:transcriptional regulator with XRE-family HTH domain
MDWGISNRIVRVDRRVEFGNRVKALRAERGLSQEELAHLARLHRTYVGAVERGERNISLVNIWRLADALVVEPSALFGPADRRVSSTKEATGTGGKR